MADPDWLVWAREIQAIAQTGLAFTPNDYDRERFEALRRLASQIMAQHTDADLDRIEGLFTEETGYATPKVGVRGAVFDPQGRILMVREAIDGDLWTLPGGWADVNQTPRQSVIREIREESGYHARVMKLAAVWDRASHAHPPSPFSVVRLFFICALDGGEATTSLETSGCGWFHEHEIPADLSLRRTLPWHIARMFAHWRDPSLPTDFD
ncbi:MAG TPA: NUDIX hydrolase [Rhodopila sp.]|uniref:NUDIX hydrolase n=1 Tax=Rhodopila sp. TaxID=2480087 RepID=UPI002D092C8C|nr:NUDIX hydrolase [Rhodopila sp.]HVY15760.1 NUDIX hydrolase [Rhodopila sp.]